MELFVVLFLFGFVCGGEYKNDDLRRIDSIRQEKDCISAGGMCTIAADCPRDQLSDKRGLCPQQKKEGIECCYGISVKETRCLKHGGRCLPLAESNCNNRLIARQATDCSDDSVCCVLV